MSDLIFTADVYDDEDICGRIIERTLEELTDDMVENLRAYALYGCTKLTTLNLLSVQSIGGWAVASCPALTDATMPLVRTIGERGFEACSQLKELRLPSGESIGVYGFAGCGKLALVLNNPDVMCAVSGGSALGAKNYYAPRAFLSDTDANSDYRRATNWSAVADRFRVLEDWTDDGTINGNIVIYAVSNALTGVTTTSSVSEIGPRSSYTATLTADTEIEEVSITMGGVDITAEVYNTETGEINIPLVTGDLVITAKAASGSFVPDAAFELVGSDFVNEGSPTTLNGMTLEGFDYTETSGSDGQGNIVTSGKERITVPAYLVSGSITFAEGFTIAFKTAIPNISQTNKYMCYLGTNTNNQFAVIYGFASQKFELYAGFNSGFRSGSQIAISDTEEHTIAYTHDKSTVCCYLDGVLVNSYAFAFDWSSNYPGTTSYIFGSSNMRDSIAAKASHLAIWNKALTAEEVANLFTEGG